MTDDTAQQPADDPLEAQIDEILADLVWEFELIRNGMELDHHTKSEAGILERDELEAAKAKLKALLVTASNSNTSLPASQ